MSEPERVPSPKVVAASEWLSQRKMLLEQEKELTRHLDRVNAARRRLPMVKLDKTYTFEGPNGEATLLDLFAGRRPFYIPVPIRPRPSSTRCSAHRRCD